MSHLDICWLVLPISPDSEHGAGIGVRWLSTVSATEIAIADGRLLSCEASFDYSVNVVKLTSGRSAWTET